METWLVAKKMDIETVAEMNQYKSLCASIISPYLLCT